MAHKLFAYGTLKNSGVQETIFGKKLKGAADILSGYERSQIYINGKKYPVAIPRRERSIHGVVLDVSKENLNSADKYETTLYKRVFLRLKSGAWAWAYVKRRNG